MRQGGLRPALNFYGPADARTTMAVGIVAENHKGEVIPYISGYKKMVAHKFFSLIANAVSYIRMMEQIPNSKGATFGGVDKKPGAKVPEWVSRLMSSYF